MAMTPVPPPSQSSLPLPYDEQNWADNSLFYGIDNLAVLQGMNTGTVDLIIMDPPFKNNGETYQGSGDSRTAAFHDYWTWRNDVHESWWEGIRGNWRGIHAVVDAVRHAVDSGTAAFVAAMAARLMECHRLLKLTGSIYVHCDPDNSPYFRLLLDAIFRADNFRSEIVWRRINGKGLAFKSFPNNYDSILYYVKSEDHVWNRVFRPYDHDYVEKSYRHVDLETGRRYSLGDLTNPNKDRPNLTYEWNGHTRVWRWTKERMQQAHEQGLIHYSSTGLGTQKRYLDEMQGVPVDTIWDDIKSLRGQSTESVGYPTQKPVALYERVISASSNPAGLILDPFCGSGTTLAAAANLSRRWTGIDLDIAARPIIESRLPNVRLNSSAPVRTDDRRNAWDEPERLNLAPTTPLQLDPRTIIPNNHERRAVLANVYGAICAGCGFSPPIDWHDDDRLEYLEVDHVTPRTGKPHDDQFGNLMLLCSPCNGRKSDKLTYAELVTRNVQEGRMKAPEARVRALAEYRERELARWNWEFGKRGKKDC